MRRYGAATPGSVGAISIREPQTRARAAWLLAPGGGREPVKPVERRGLDVDAAHAWIAGHRVGREPWQRADASIVRMRERGTPLTGVAVQRGDAIAGAAICLIDHGLVRVLQIATVDRAAARDLVLAAAGELTLRLANVPGDDVFADVLRELGAGLTVAQHEMRLRVADGADGAAALVSDPRRRHPRRATVGSPGVDKPRVVRGVLIRVRAGERGDGLVKAVTAAQIARDGRRVPGAGVAQGQGLPACASVLRQFLG